jgi:hypothetical protein
VGATAALEVEEVVLVVVVPMDLVMVMVESSNSTASLGPDAPRRRHRNSLGTLAKQ